MQDFNYLTAFIIGLMGGVHCIGMCGGIVAAMSFSQARPSRHPQLTAISLLLSYNVGRLFSYTLAGTLMGGIGWLATHWLDIRQLQLLLQLMAALFMVFLGLYLAGWWSVLMHIEKIGGRVWRRIEPLGHKFLPVSQPTQAVLLGLIWGWLPCGLVYSVLIWSISAGGFVEGGLLMLSFGLGTLPNLLAMGLFANRLQNWLHHAWVRQLAGSLVMLFGVWGLYRVIVSV
ncbi:MAG: sulfite exporter TauE/SafE family protein [Gammaproteobacteria bacterium]|nr:sulfite exporter TauE/SafE family protein [Gammaproteobacteria bacterium]